eukprot:TRINITY_DN1384_c0_g1_i4.p1 TRINITY_DN1384_c0_g1~~TRINITY_DN1384_c0_g1_i4.p1  ORF type:complete len:156 (-),score=4.11 TRINITY_DN1384_c0_g1_i4:585-1052(-)
MRLANSQAEGSERLPSAYLVFGSNYLLYTAFSHFPSNCDTIVLIGAVVLGLAGFTKLNGATYTYCEWTESVTLRFSSQDIARREGARKQCGNQACTLHMERPVPNRSEQPSAATPNTSSVTLSAIITPVGGQAWSFSMSNWHHIVDAHKFSGGCF